MSDDPFELLSRLAPRLDDRVFEPGDDEDADALLRQIVSTPRTSGQNDHVVAQSRRRSHRKRIMIVGAVMVGLAGAGTAAAVVLTSRPANPAVLMCYSDAAAEPAARAVLPIDPATTPEAQCGDAWSDGPLGTSDPPPLVTCISEHEATVVLPGGPATCADVGMTPAAPPTPSDDLDALVALSIPNLFLDGCVDDLEHARDRVDALIDELSATGWTVRVEGETAAERPCATTVIDAVRREVLVIAF